MKLGVAQQNSYAVLQKMGRITLEALNEPPIIMVMIIPF
jgi:hypothetical protein